MEFKVGDIRLHGRDTMEIVKDCGDGLYLYKWLTIGSVIQNNDMVFNIERATLVRHTKRPLTPLEEVLE